MPGGRDAGRQGSRETFSNRASCWPAWLWCLDAESELLAVVVCCVVLCCVVCGVVLADSDTRMEPGQNELPFDLGPDIPWMMWCLEFVFWDWESPPLD